MSGNKSWVCKVCGYVHKGEEAPETCPVCSVTRENFEELKSKPQPEQEKIWVCKVCGYIHKGVTPPESCPVCGVGQDMFEEQQLVQAAPIQGDQWQCSVCEYIHKGKTPPQTCPVCGVASELFSPFEQETESPHPSDQRNIVIIGDGIAGFTAAESAREQNKTAEILLISKEGVRPYFRLNLTRYLGGEVNENSLEMKDTSWYEEKNIQWRSAEVTAIKTAEKKVELNTAEELSYDKLILANGSHPFIPPFPGVTREGVSPLRTLKDAKLILNKISKQTHCLIIGGGLLGLEAAVAIKNQGAEVSVVEGYGWLLPRQLPETAGKMLVKHMEKKGIHIIQKARVKNILGDETVKGVELNTGETVSADLIVISTGVRSNSYLARLAGLKTENGVVVNDLMLTSDPDIYAAGDVAEHRGVSYGIWPASYSQGAVAGTNAAGGSANFSGLTRSNQLKVSDVDLFSIGKIQPEDGSYQVVEKQDGGNFIYLVCKDNKIVGGVLYGDISLATEIKNAIEQKLQIPQLSALQKAVPKLGEMSF